MPGAPRARARLPYVAGVAAARPAIHHHEAFFDGSLILTAEQDRLREERRYKQLLDRATVSWINNCSTPEALVDNFISALMKIR